jgi:type II secretory pathway component GspD/PulD (secretin)
MRLIEQIDTAPAQVVVQVLIAEVDLTGTEEFGVEFGLQAPVLFRRSVGLPTVNTSISGSPPGFNFNNPSLPLPSNFAADPSVVGFQGLSNLGTGRVSPNNGTGGFVFSAASDTFNLLIRALKTQGRVEILSRPQIQAFDNQVAYATIGQSVPTVAGQFLAGTGGSQNNIQYRDVGVLLAVTPRISPDGTVLMRIVPEVSAVSPNLVSLGNGLMAPQFTVEHFETTVSVQDGETIALGGLITKRDAKSENKLPWLGDLPYIGAAFRFRTQIKERRELLVILTPHIIRSPLDADRILAEEARRIQMTLKDVVDVHGTSGMAPILLPPPGAHGAGPGAPSDPAHWPGISCPPPLPTEPGLSAPAAQETLPAPRTGPGPQSRAPPASGVQQASNFGSAVPVETPKEKQGWSPLTWKR